MQFKSYNFGNERELWKVQKKVLEPTLVAKPKKKREKKFQKVKWRTVVCEMCVWMNQASFNDDRESAVVVLFFSIKLISLPNNFYIFSFDLFSRKLEKKESMRKCWIEPNEKKKKD